jgi:DNA-binding NarL/FixJ family response regulator
MSPKGIRDRSAGTESDGEPGMPAAGDADPSPRHTLELTVSPEILDESVTMQGLLLGGALVTGGYAVPPSEGEPGPEYCYSLTLVPADGLRPVAAEAPRIRVLIVNREPLILRGLESVLGEEPDLEVIGEASRGAEALALADQLAPDVVVVDPNLPDMSGLSVVEALHRAQSPARPVILAPQITDKDFIQARQLGVRGVVLTTMPAHLIVQCIRTVHAGDEFLEKDTLIKALTTLMRRRAATEPQGNELTDREREVAELVAAGLSNTEIARRLNCGPGTVKSHLHSIYDKLGVHSRYALMRFSGDQNVQ